jgi:nucleotide-binding universal stress UspA family protein
LRHIADASVDLVVGDTPADRGAIPVLASDPIATITRRADVPVFVVEHRSIQTPIRRILVPTDFSEHARGAFEHAKALARLYNASLDVLHVLERPQYVALNTTDMLAMSDATLTERKARRRAETFAASVNGEPVSTRVHVRHGDAADCIGHFMDETPIDLVVLSTHGVIGRPTHPFGSVVEKVLRRVAHPVFLTRAFGGSVVESLRSASGSDGAVGSTPSVDPKLP